MMPSGAPREGAWYDRSRWTLARGSGLHRPRCSWPRGHPGLGRARRGFWRRFSRSWLRRAWAVAGRARAYFPRLPEHAARAWRWAGACCPFVGRAAVLPTHGPRRHFLARHAPRAAHLSAIVSHPDGDHSSGAPSAVPGPRGRKLMTLRGAQHQTSSSGSRLIPIGWNWSSSGARRGPAWGGRPRWKRWWGSSSWPTSSSTPRLAACRRRFRRVRSTEAVHRRSSATFFPYMLAAGILVPFAFLAPRRVARCSSRRTAALDGPRPSPEPRSSRPGHRTLLNRKPVRAWGPASCS